MTKEEENEMYDEKNRAIALVQKMTIIDERAKRIAEGVIDTRENSTQISSMRSTSSLKEEAMPTLVLSSGNLRKN